LRRRHCQGGNAGVNVCNHLPQHDALGGPVAGEIQSRLSGVCQPLHVGLGVDGVCASEEQAARMIRAVLVKEADQMLTLVE
jgi:hypothetical protein